MKTIAAKTALFLSLFAMAFAASAQAQTTSPATGTDSLGTVKTTPDGTSIYPGFTPPPFKVNAEPRTMKTGAEVAVFGGITFMQGGDFKESYGVGATKSSWWANTRNHVGEVFGAKAGYTWPGLGKGAGFTGDGPREIDEDEKFKLLPSAEFEFFYSNHKYEGKGPLYSSGAGARAVDETDFRANMQEYVFTVNPVLRAQIWRFRPYVGVGIGGAIVQLKDATVAPSITQTGTFAVLNNPPDDQYTLCLAGQFELGTDFFITKSVSIFAEYKLLALFNPVFKGPGNFNYEADYAPESLATAGVRYHF